MKLGLEDKNFIVAASSKGLGFSVVRELLKEGSRVLMTSSSRKNLEVASQKLTTEGLDRHQIWVADLTRQADIERVVREAEKSFGKIDGLVTNCGGPPAGHPLEISDEQWHAAFESVFLSVVRLCRYFIPLMVEQGGGSVLAISSTTVKQPIANLTTSNALRPALAGYLKYVSNEYALKNVRINLAAPGRIITERTTELDAALAKKLGITPQEARVIYTREIPMGRLGELEEFSAMCAFLLSSKASYITGQTICIDGGRVSSIF